VIESIPAGVILNVRVIPRAGRSGLAPLDKGRGVPSPGRGPGTRGDALLVRLTSPPVEGAANAELLDLLSDLLDVPKRALTIVSGERSRHKRVRVDGLDAATIESRLSNLR
jgi:uncharacterized protein (TIGR00251 family)